MLRRLAAQHGHFVVDWAVYGRALGPVQMAGVLLMGLAIWRVRKPAV